MAAARPLVTVYTVEGKSTNEQLKTPSVLLAPIRTDVVQFVHTSMAKNSRQPYGVSENAGHQHSAESWGTGRAVARIPRVSGGGTSRSGQGAFGNMCRKGRMFAPTKVWRKWHRKINQNQRRYAVASALAASAIPSLVLARGHRIEAIPEVPLVVDGAEKINKTKQAVTVLTALGAFADVEKAKESRKIRAGVGKMRNRRHVQRRGPLVVYSEDNGICQAFRNLPGVELCHVDRLNLLQLAPGGHIGRLILWTKAAFKRLDEIWGSITRESVQKKGYTLPRPIMTQSDLGRLINSDEIQSKIRPTKKASQRAPLKKNPLVNLGAMVKLNPYTLSLRRSELLSQERQKKHKEEALEAKRKKLKAKLTVEEKAKMEADKKHDRMEVTVAGKGGKTTKKVVKTQKSNYLAISADADVKKTEKKVYRTELPRDPTIKVGRVKVVRVKKAPKGGAKGKKEEGKEGEKKEEKKEDPKAAAAAKKDEKPAGKKK